MVQKIPWFSASQVLRGGEVNPVSPIEEKEKKSPYGLFNFFFLPEYKTL